MEKPVSTLTEAADLIECLHKALPKEYQAKSKRYFENGRWKNAKVSFMRKNEAVYQNINHVNVADAIQCYVQEQLEDAAYARAGKEIGKGARHTGRQFGLGIGAPTNWRF